MHPMCSFLSAAEGMHLLLLWSFSCVGQMLDILFFMVGSVAGGVGSSDESCFIQTLERTYSYFVFGWGFPVL